MKNCLYYILLSALTMHAGVAQTNHALFVAIDQYPSHSGWSKLHGTNDYYLLEPLLRKNNYQIETLMDEKATKANIVQALNRLHERTHAGDYIYVHFSCHGQQMADDNFDEEDGWDEAIVPYDAFYRYMPSYYEGENHLRDDELEVHLNAIRLKAGTNGNVVVIVDACHSGTVNREDEGYFIRGTTFPFDKQRYTDERVKDKQRNSLPEDPEMSPIYVLMACQPGEVNCEYLNPADGKQYGSLSWAFNETLASKKAYTMTELTNRVDSVIKNIQKKRKYPQTPYQESSDENGLFKLSQ